MNSPLTIFVGSFVALCVAAQLGQFMRRSRGDLDDRARHDFDLVLGATLTLLGLVIGFTLSMADNRYEQRKNYEEEEANAIGTEYLRADLLPAADAQKVKPLLVKYLDLRIAYYNTTNADQLQEINVSTAQLESSLWLAVKSPAAANQTSVVSLAVAGMNDVINSEGYTQAAWRNRVPAAAWFLLIIIGICANLLMGYGARSSGKSARWLLALPLIVSISFLLIADIDSPRGGVIRIHPTNLTSLSQSLREVHQDSSSQPSF